MRACEAKRPKALEGFDTPDLKDAKALFEQMAA